MLAGKGEGIQINRVHEKIWPKVENRMLKCSDSLWAGYIDWFPRQWYSQFKNLISNMYEYRLFFSTNVAGNNRYSCMTRYNVIHIYYVSRNS